jgi:hypothetical protein
MTIAFLALLPGLLIGKSLFEHVSLPFGDRELFLGTVKRGTIQPAPGFAGPGTWLRYIPLPGGKQYAVGVVPRDNTPHNIGLG